MRLRAVAMVAISACIALTILFWVRANGGPLEIREAHGLWGVPLSMLIHMLLNLSPLAELVPSAPANGAVWGLWVGSMVNWVGWMGSSAVQYEIARRTGEQFDATSKLENAPRWLSHRSVSHPLFQILGRSVPWVGTHVVNVASGAHGLPFGRFMLFAAIGQASPAIFMAALGMGVFELFARVA